MVVDMGRAEGPIADLTNMIVTQIEQTDRGVATASIKCVVVNKCQAGLLRRHVQMVEPDKSVEDPTRYMLQVVVPEIELRQLGQMQKGRLGYLGDLIERQV